MSIEHGESSQQSSQPAPVSNHPTDERLAKRRKTGSGEALSSLREPLPQPRGDNGRLIVVSNRMIDPKKPAAGGVAVALAESVKDAGGVWFGWSGEVTKRDKAPKVTEAPFGEAKLVGVDLTKKQFDNYYSGYYNSVLWPVMQNSAQWADFKPKFYNEYKEVNKMFASKLAPLLEKDDVLWVHDCHLIPLAEELRSLGCQQRMGFFNHSPFPDPSLFKAIPQHQELMASFFSYDLVGMQIPRDVDAFRGYVEKEKVGTDAGGDAIEAFNRKVAIQHFPIGIDVAALDALGPGEDSKELIDQLKGERKKGRTLMIGVERLDYAKGIPDRLAALGELLERRPDLIGKITFVQIAAPSRQTVPAYAQLAENTLALVNEINNRYGTKSWSPIVYIDNSVNRNALPEIYRMSRVGVVTSVADGMNLVSKEYVAAQNPNNPGALILSTAAGSSYQLKQAIQVPPQDISAIAGAYEEALAMRLGERRERHEALLDNVRTENLDKWRTDYLAALRAAPASTEDQSSGKPPGTANGD